MTLGDSPVSLAYLARRSAVVAYQDLATLLHGLPANDDAGRKRLILDFCLRLRHRLARLLSLAHWAPRLGSVAVHAAKADALADERDFSYEEAADALWHLSTNLDRNPVVMSARTPIAVSEAVRALRGDVVVTLPSKIETQVLSVDPYKRCNRIKPDDPKSLPNTFDKHDDLKREGVNIEANSIARARKRSRVKPVTRLCPSTSLPTATRALIRLCVPQLDGLCILRWRAGPQDAFVAVGVPAAWEALLTLTTPDAETAFFRVHSVAVLFGGGYQGESVRFLEKDGLCISGDQEKLLASLASKRMASAVKTTASGFKGRAPRAIAMLNSLYNLLTFEFCAPLLIERLRNQATELKATAWKDVAFDVVPSPNLKGPPGTPLVLTYWNDCRDASRLVITPAQRKSTHKRPRDGAVAHQQYFQLITITHDPPLPIVSQESAYPGALDDQMCLEGILLRSLNARAVARLYALAESIQKHKYTLRLTSDLVRLKYLNIECTAPVLTVFFKSPPSSGVEIRVSMQNGALKGRPFGATYLTCNSSTFVKSELLHGQCQCSTMGEEEAAVISTLDNVCNRIKLDTVARSGHSVDLGVAQTLPPESSWAIPGASPDDSDARRGVPPFIPLARNEPSRFLSLSFLPRRPRDRVKAHGTQSSRHTGVSSEWRRYMAPSSKRHSLDYAFTRDQLVFIQDTDFITDPSSKKEVHDMRRFDGTAAATASWITIHASVERRMRRDSLLRAFTTARVASSANKIQPKASTEDYAILQLETASRTAIRVKSEPLPLRDAELILRGNDAWQIRCFLLPSIFDDTDTVPKRRRLALTRPFGGYGTMWAFGMATVGNVLTFTYPSANAASVRAFFKDLTRARTAAALARGVPRSRFYRVERRSPIRMTLALGPFNRHAAYNTAHEPTYHATVEYLYSKGNSGGFSVCFKPPMPTMRLLAPLIEESLDSAGGTVGLVLSGLLERAAPVAAAAESAVRGKGEGRIRFVTALRVRAVFAGMPIKNAAHGKEGLEGLDGLDGGTMKHAVDLDARGDNGADVAVVDVGRATSVMIASGFAPKSGGASPHSGPRKTDFFPLPGWDEIVTRMCAGGDALPQRTGATVFLRMEALENFLTALVASAKGSSGT